ncbi:MAG TPA: hypothetical protein VE913_21835 [Longimicrobium sp.]|nr:hypothetical protein [Longimicrobium sp.]
MMKMRWIGVVLVSLAAGCAPLMRSAPAPTEAMDAAVYATVLDLLPGSPILLVDSLFVVSAGSYQYEKISQHAGKALADDLLRRGSDPRTVPAPLPTRNAVRVVQRRELGREFRRGNPEALEAVWRSFNDRYPNSDGYFQVSAVGYDRDGTRAVLYLGHWCGMLCGEGRIVTLARVGTGWKVLESPIISES